MNAFLEILERAENIDPREPNDVADELRALAQHVATREMIEGRSEAARTMIGRGEHVWRIAVEASKLRARAEARGLDPEGTRARTLDAILREGARIVEIARERGELHADVPMGREVDTPEGREWMKENPGAWAPNQRDSLYGEKGHMDNRTTTVDEKRIGDEEGEPVLRDSEWRNRGEWMHANVALPEDVINEVIDLDEALA